MNRVCVNVEGSGTKRSVEDRSVDSRNSRRKLIRRDELRRRRRRPKGRKEGFSIFTKIEEGGSGLVRSKNSKFDEFFMCNFSWPRR